MLRYFVEAYITGLNGSVAQYFANDNK